MTFWDGRRSGRPKWRRAHAIDGYRRYIAVSERWMGRWYFCYIVVIVKKYRSTVTLAFAQASVLALVFSAAIGSPVLANTINAASCSAADVQSAINSAPSGSTVAVPAGTCTWTGRVTIPGTLGIVLSGGGNTTINNANIVVNSNTTVPTEITGFNFTGTYASTAAPAISVQGCGGLSSCGGTTTAIFRVDHNTFTDPTEIAIFIQTSGNGTGLIDSNTFVGGGASEMIHNMGMGAVDASGWTDAVLPGSPNMLYIETNTFTFNASGNPAYFWGTSAVQSYYGARTVFRYNTLNNVEVDQHGTCGNIGARWWEVYNNTFNVAVNGNQSNYMGLRDGSGLVFNNQVSNPANNAGAGVIAMMEDCTSGTYPLNYQVGRGINETYSPAYVWGNDSSMTVAANNSFVVQGRDYFVSTAQPASMLRDQLSSDTPTTTYSYTPYSYPYPYSSSGSNSSAVASPTGLTATVH